MTLLRPLGMTYRPRPADALPLAGSRAAWWHTALQDGAEREAAALDPATRARLSDLRPAICGLRLDRPLVMGILNVTPDSFSDGGRHFSLDAAVARARQMATEAEIIDIGGESTRPGSRAVPEDEEIARTAPVIRAIRAAGIATPISIDTRKARVAAAALDAGADMLNDVTAMRFDPDMARVAADRQVPICLMHSVADPEAMQQHARYDDVVREVYDHLAGRIDVALSAGIAMANIIADPGIGFGKVKEHNLALLDDLAAFHGLGVPLLLGVSRKRFIGTIGRAEVAADRMPGSVAVALHGATQGVQILRVHDTAETRQALRLWQALAGDEESEDGA